MSVLGVDVGGVIVDRVAEREDTSFFGSRPLETPPVDGVFEALAEVARELFAGRVYIVSKAGPRVEANTRAWLAHQRFFERTGLSPDNVYFVRERADKAPVCRELGVTHFVDDLLEVLSYLDFVRYRYLFTGGLGHNEPPRAVPRWAIRTASWPELVAELRTSLTPDPGW
ncbi:MAG TPA: hypothetical protein VFE14_20015 [Micromonosporaceae bacterium]|jgi:hypothetical protein|nr:hypothetical protein [Micromonosporaceae bacterium]